MKKKIIIGVLSLVVILVAFLFYANNRNRTMSPPGSVELRDVDLKVSVAYSRPSVRGRVIFGSEAQGALQPYGKYWRLGANEPTTISFSKDVKFNGETVKAGTYTIYAYPGDGSFDVVLNSEVSFWGVSEPDHATDVLRTKVTTLKNEASVEQYTITLEPLDRGIDLTFAWSDTKFSIQILPNN
jgi:Protein of unknown function (DUF2911)